MSTLVLTALQIQIVLISYDIACSYHKNFSRRYGEMPTELQFGKDTKTIGWAVPKFHLQAHGPSCQTKFSLNYMPGVGRTHGEGVESNWALTNPAALSSREMGGASRHEMLNDIFGAVNWQKTTNLRTSMDKLLVEAVEECDVQRIVFDELEDTIPPEYRERWEQMVIAWEADKSQPDPYEESIKCTLFAEVRAEIQMEEADEVARGVMALHETTASAFLNTGLELEEQQRVLRAQAKRNDQTLDSMVKLNDKCSILRSRIALWRKIQAIYMPGVAQLLEHGSHDDDDGDGDGDVGLDDDITGDSFGTDKKPEASTLWMPSDLPSELRQSGCVPGLLDKERRLCIGQADDTLHHICCQLRMQSSFLHYKHVQISGPSQGTQTRAMTLLEGLNRKPHCLVEQYQAAHAVLVAVDPDGNWSSRLRPLQRNELRGPTTQDEGIGQGRKMLMWIWRVQWPDAWDMRGDGDEPASEEELHESARVEWAVVRTRVKRWDEEVLLLQEEMRRTVCFFEWKAGDWASKVGKRSGAARDVAVSADAHAEHQAAIYTALALACAGRWRRTLLKLGLEDMWPKDQYDWSTLERVEEPAVFDDNDGLSTEVATEAGDEAGDEAPVSNTPQL